MFRLIVEPNNPKSSGDYIPVLDKIWEDFNDFKIDMTNNQIVASIKPNHKKHHNLSIEEMKNLLKESWDIYKLKYHFEPYPSSIVKIDIPKDYNVQVILI